MLSLVLDLRENAPLPPSPGQSTSLGRLYAVWSQPPAVRSPSGPSPLPDGACSETPGAVPSALDLGAGEYRPALGRLSSRSAEGCSPLVRRACVDAAETPAG